MAMRYPGGFISSTAPTVNANTAKGVWTLEEAMQYIRAGQWPVPTGNGDPYFQYNTMLLPGQGTNGAQNNTFLDSSTNNFTITRNGNTTQGTFTPFSGTAGNWSNYFDGSGDYLSLANNAAFDFGTGDMTIECWFYLTGDAALNSDSTRSASLFSAFPDSGGVNTDYNFSIDGNSTTTGTSIVFGRRISGTLTSVVYTTTISKNQWHHAAAVRSGSSLSVYLDGVRVAQNSSYSGNIDTGGHPIKVGALAFFPNSPGYANQFPGYISNLRVLKGTAQYSGATYTVPIAPLTAITNTSLLTCQSNRFVDNSTNAFALTVNGNPAVTPFQPFGAPTSAYSASTIGGSGYFDGTGDNLAVPTNSANSVGSGSFYFEAWVYLTNPSAGQMIVADPSNTGGLFVGLNIDGSNRFAIGRTAVAVDNFVTVTWAGNQWYHLAVNRNGTSLQFFVNGTQVGSTGTNSVNYPSVGYRVGAEQSAGSSALTGYISGLRLVKSSVNTSNFAIPTAPPDASTSALCLQFTNAGIIDNAQDNDLETVGGAQISTTQYKWGASSMYFDGTGDQLIAPSNEVLAFGTGDFTVELWARFSSLSTYNTLCATRPATTGTADGWTFGATSSGTVYMYTDSFVAQSGTGVISTSTWYHISLVRVGTTVKIFVNGNQVATGTNSQNLTRKILYVGNNTPNDEPFTGYLADLRVTKGYARYPYNFTAPTAAFPLFYQAAATPSSDPYFDYTTLLLPGNGTNGANNNTFLDSSTNAFTITRNGNTTQGTFTPFSQTGWGNYFDGSGDYLTVASSADFNIFGGDMTFECWFYSTAASLGSRSEHLFAFVQDATNRESLYFNGTTLTFWTSSGAGNGPRITYANTPQNQWIHVAVTKSGSLFTMYINGVSVGTSTTTQYSTSNQSLQIGTYNNAGTAADSFTGYISNVRVVKGTNVYTTNFIPSTTPLTAVTNTVLLTCQINRFVDTNTQVAAKTVTPSGDTSVQAFSPFNPTAAYSTSTVGGSGYFDGTGDYLVTPSSSNLAVGTGDFCVEMWLYTPASAASQNLYTNANSSVGGDTGLGIFLTSTTAVRLASWNTAFLTTGTGVIVGNQWNHIAVCRSGTTASIFVNGTRQATGTVSNNFSSTSAFTIGSAVSPGDYLTGYISSLRTVKGSSVYDPTQTTLTLPTAPLTAITNTSLLMSGTNGGIIDNTAKNNLETVGGASISTTVSKFGGSSMYFDGSGDYLDVLAANQLSNFSSGDWTIEAWIYRSTASANHCILNFINSAGTNAGLTFQVSSSNQLVSDNGTVAALAAGTVPSNQWVHIAIARYSGTTTGYINGVAVGTTTQAPSASQYLRIGALGNGGYAYHGYINDLRVTKGIARYTQNFTPPTTAFLTL